MIAAPGARIVEAEFPDCFDVVNDRASGVEPGGEAQTDLIGSRSEYAGRKFNLQGTWADRHVFQWVDCGIEAIALIDDSSIEPQELHESVDSGNSARRRVLDTDKKRM